MSVSSKFSLQGLVARSSLTNFSSNPIIKSAIREWNCAFTVEKDRECARKELQMECDSPAAPMREHPTLWRQKTNPDSSGFFGPRVSPPQWLFEQKNNCKIAHKFVKPDQLDSIWSEPALQHMLWEYITLGMLPLSFLQSQQLVPAGGSLFRILWQRFTRKDVKNTNLKDALPSVQQLREAALSKMVRKQNKSEKDIQKQQDWSAAVLLALSTKRFSVSLSKKNATAFCRCVRTPNLKRTCKSKYRKRKKYTCVWLFRWLKATRFHKLVQTRDNSSSERTVHAHTEKLLFSMGFARKKQVPNDWTFLSAQHNNRKQWDIDLFFVDDNKKTEINNETAKAIISNVYKHLRNNLPPQLSILCIRTERAVTLRCPWPFPTVQIILRPFGSLDKLLGSFDLDCTRIAFAPSKQEPNGELWCQSSLTRVLTRGTGNVASDMYMNPNYERRLLKYFHMGVPVSLGVDFQSHNWFTPHSKPGLGRFLSLLSQSTQTQKFLHVYEADKTLNVPLGQDIDNLYGVSEVLPGYSDSYRQTEKFLAEVSSVAIYDRASGYLSAAAIAARNDDIQGLLQSSHLRFRLSKTKQGVRFACPEEIKLAKVDTEKTQLVHAVLETNVPPFTIWSSSCQFLHASTRHSHPALQPPWKLSPSVQYSWL